MLKTSQDRGLAPVSGGGGATLDLLAEMPLMSTLGDLQQHLQSLPYGRLDIPLWPAMAA